jgi:hypothetical protein
MEQNMWGIISSSALQHSYHTVLFQTQHFMNYMHHFSHQTTNFLNAKFICGKKHSGTSLMFFFIMKPHSEEQQQDSCA